MFISFEGGDGVGKTTQSRLLSDYLKSRGVICHLIREPGGTPLSEKIRTIFIADDRDPLTDLLLILAARNENLEKIIKPALARGETVIADRFIDSTLVYQGVAGGLGLEYVTSVIRLLDMYYEPDLTLVLDIDPEKSNNRIKDRQSDRFDCRENEYHQIIRDGFLALAHEDRHVIVDSDRTRESVQESIISVISARYQF